MKKKSKLEKVFYKLGKTITQVRLAYLEGLNSSHLRIRKLHDVTYQRGGKYKSWTDKTYSSSIHKVSLWGFIASFVIFSLLQNMFPLFNLGQPTEVRAGSDTVTWTTTSEFINNGATGGNYAGATSNNGNIDTSGDEMTLLLDDTWLDGRAGTAMEGKQVYYQNSANSTWGPYPGSCVGPQCATGLDPNFPADYALVASNTVDFSAYPARDACKAIGGRLPYMNELLELYAAGWTSYGGFNTGYYWSATEYSTDKARTVYFDHGGIQYTNNKNASYYVRCVRSPAIYAYNSPGVISGYRIDNGTNYNSTWNQISWNGTEPTGDTDIKFRTRGSNLADPSGASVTGNADTGWTYWNEDSGGTTYYETTDSNIVTPKTRWLEAEVTLETTDANETPTVTDFTITSTLQAPDAGNLAQQKSDDSGFITEGGWHNAGVKLSVDNVSGFEDATNFYGEFEVKPVGTDFDGADTVDGSTVNPGETTEVTVNKDPDNYKWRVRLYDGSARVSPWTEFNSGDSAFQIDQTAPIVSTFTINSDDAFTDSTSVTLNIDASDTGGSSPTPADLEMQFSNDGTIWGTTTDIDGVIQDSGTWATYSTLHSWNVTSGDSPPDKDVYVKVEDNGGNNSTDFVFNEDFSTDTYKDGGSTTANWDKVAGKIDLTSSSQWVRVSSNWLPSDPGSFGTPTFADIDDDGDYDLAVGDSGGLVKYFRNDGTASIPSWTYVSSDWLPAVAGTFSSPAFADIDNDGDYDLAVGYLDGYIGYFRNDGTASIPSWTHISSDWLSLDTGTLAKPAFADIDDDGDYDLAVGGDNGLVQYIRNNGTASIPSWSRISTNWLPADVIDRSTPSFADIDNDGDYDLAVGDKTGFVEYFRNDGTASIPSWTHISVNWLAVDFGYNAAPAFADMDDDGDYDLAVGDQDSVVEYFRNDTTYSTPATAQSLTLDSTSGNIAKATLTATETLNGQTITYQMSANGGANWESVTSGVEHTFTNAGSDLKWKATLNGTSSATPELTNIEVSYIAETSDQITLDTSPPTVFDLDIPADGTWQNSDSTPPLSWDESVSADVDHYELYIDGSTDSPGRASVDPATYCAAGTCTIDTAAILSEENHTWYVKAVDGATNSTESNPGSASPFNLGFDESAPSLGLDGDFTFTASDSNNDNVTLNWGTYADTSGDGSPAATYTIDEAAHEKRPI